MLEMKVPCEIGSCIYWRVNGLKRKVVGLKATKTYGTLIVVGLVVFAVTSCTKSEFKVGIPIYQGFVPMELGFFFFGFCFKYFPCAKMSGSSTVFRNLCTKIKKKPELNLSLG